MKTSHGYLLLLGAAALAWFGGTAPEPPPAPVPPPPASRAELNAIDKQARELAIGQLEDQFERWRLRAPLFAESLTRPRTRLALIKRSGEDWISGQRPAGPARNRVEELVRDKFRDHLLSEGELQQAVADALARYATEVAAGCNRLAAEGRLPADHRILQHTNLPWEAGDLMRPPEEHWGDESVQTLIASGIGGEVAALILTRMAVNATQAMATQVATQGSASVAGAAIGGSGGSAAAPGVGTVIGFGIGLVAGVAIDYWMTERFETEVADTSVHYLNQLEFELLYGSPAHPQADTEWPGMLALLQPASGETSP